MHQARASARNVYILAIAIFTTLACSSGRDAWASSPNASQPNASQPNASQPNASQPNASQPNASQPNASSPNARSPNIVIVFTDDQGYGDLSCYGSETFDTPRLDALADEGTRFTNFYAQIVCGPSRSALLTGRYPVRSRGWSMPADEITVAELLQQIGYTTGCIGKWDVSNRAAIPERMPIAQGFDYYYGTLGANDNARVVIHENNREVGRTDDMASLTRIYTNKGIEFLEANKDGPFFLYVAHTMVHSVIDASPEFKGRSKGGLYGDTMEELDYHTGRLLDAIDNLGLRENTLVVFTTDNGPWSNMQDVLRKRHDGAVAWGSAGPLREAKGSTYEGGLRVPCIARWPGRVPEGRTSDAIFATVDFLPTFATLAGFKPPADRIIDGVDQTDLLLGNRPDGARDDYYYFCRNELHAVRKGDWKLVLPNRQEFYGYVKDRGSQDAELYNLATDIGEKNNLASQHADVVAELTQLAKGFRWPADLQENPIRTSQTDSRAAGWSPTGIYEGETLAEGVAAARVQQMKSFGPDWSGGKQMLWEGVLGDELSVEFTIDRPYRGRFALQLTKAPNYGVIKIQLDGKNLGGAIDLFAADVKLAPLYDAGSIALEAGAHRLTFRTIGANEKASLSGQGGSRFGLDYVWLRGKDRFEAPRGRLTKDAKIHADRPNVVLIMADDMGYECVGANGGESYTTPNLDRLAAAGMRFEHCHSQPICTPSRVQIMTGIYNSKNYVRFGLLDSGQRTFANALRYAGYATCIVGKWQLSGGMEGPPHFGFDEYSLWQLARRPNRYPNPGIEINGREFDYKGGDYGPDIVSDYACDFIERHQDTPFFLYYPMILPHWPFEPTPDSEDWDPTARRDDKSETGANKTSQRHFADMVAFTDKMAGKVISKIDEVGLRDNTLVIFTCDNGTMDTIDSLQNGRTIRGGKRWTRDNGTHVPLIARWPPHIDAGSVNRDLVDFSDVYPTLLDATGVCSSPDAELDGRSFLPQLMGAKGNPREWIYCWYYRNGDPEGEYADKQAGEFARNHRYKYYRDGRFYNVVADSLEQHPLEESSLSEPERAVRHQLRRVVLEHARADGAN